MHRPSSGFSWSSAVLLAVIVFASPARAGDEVRQPPVQGGQGRWLHGTADHDFELVNIPLDSAGPERCRCPRCPHRNHGFSDGNLWVDCPRKDGKPGPLKGEDLADTFFQAPLKGRSALFKIVSVQPHKGPKPELWEYRVKVNRNRTDVQSKWTDLCPDQGYALAVPNAWSAAAGLVKNDGHFSFACVPQTGEHHGISGAIAKCIDWGYPPWGRPGSPDRGPLQFHQACVRMAMGDYCGEGNPNTFDGTPIAFFNSSQIAPGELVPNARPKGDGGGPFIWRSGDKYYLKRQKEEDRRYHLEAIWGLDSCGKVEVKCLGKKRYDTLSPSAACLNSQMLKACHEGVGRADALFYSYSLHYDSSLVSFVHRVDGARGFLTTTSVARKPDVYTNDSYEVAADDDDGPGGGSDKGRVDAREWTMRRLEGPTVNKNIGADLAAKLGLLPLKRYTTAGGQHITVPPGVLEGLKVKVTQPEAGVLEAYIYPDNETQERVPLILWEHGDTGVYATTIESPGDEYRVVKTLGYLPGIGDDDVK